MSHTLPRCCGRRCLQGKRLPQRDCRGRHSPKLCSRLAAAPQRAKLQTAPLPPPPRAQCLPRPARPACPCALCLSATAAPARQQVDSACVPGYTIFRASLPTCICAPTARVLRTSPPSSRARWPPRPACPCVLSLPAFARARSGLLQHRLYVRLLPTLPCRGLSKNPWTLATGWSWGGIQLSRGAPPTTPLGRGATLAAANPKSLNPEIEAFRPLQYLAVRGSRPRNEQACLDLGGWGLGVY